MNYNGITMENYESIMLKREKFQSYPYFIKHTIFHYDEEITSIRNLPLKEKIEACFKLIESGNKLIEKNKSFEALSIFERVTKK